MDERQHPDRIYRAIQGDDCPRCSATEILDAGGDDDVDHDGFAVGLIYGVVISSAVWGVLAMVMML